MESACGSLESKPFPALSLMNLVFVQLSLENLQESMLHHPTVQPVPLLPRILLLAFVKSEASKL